MKKALLLATTLIAFSLSAQANWWDQEEAPSGYSATTEESTSTQQESQESTSTSSETAAPATPAPDASTPAGGGEPECD